MNTFMDEDIARITTKDDWNTGSPSQIDFVMSSSSLVGVDTGVDEHMNFTTDHGPVWATFQFAALASVQSFSPQKVPRASVRWKPRHTWSDAAACFDWNWTPDWSDVSSK